MGLTQTELAKRLSLSFFQYKDLESGRVKISPMLAKLIFYETGYNVDWLLKGDGEMIPSGTNAMDGESGDARLLITLMEMAEEIIEDNKMAITPGKTFKTIMFVYQDIKDEVSGFDYNKEKLKTKLCRYLDLAK